MNRQSGSLLIELIFAMTILVIGILAFLGSFFSNYKAVSTIQEMDKASVALSTVAEQMGLMQLEDVHANYDGRAIDVPELRAPGGGTAQIFVTCHVNEAALPAAFAAVQDIDGKPGTTSSDCSTSYKILPVQLTLSYQTFNGSQTQEVYTVLYSD